MLIGRSAFANSAPTPHDALTLHDALPISVIATNGTLTITTRDLLISAADKTKVYGAGNPTFTGSISGVQNSDPIAESFTPSATLFPYTTLFRSVPHADATAAVLANYTVIATNGTLTTTKRAPLISAADKTKVYGAGNPTFTGSISGVQNSDPIAESFTTSADASSGIGDYAIVPHADATAAVLAN